MGAPLYLAGRAHLSRAQAALRLAYRLGRPGPGLLAAGSAAGCDGAARARPRLHRRLRLQDRRVRWQRVDGGLLDVSRARHLPLRPRRRADPPGLRPALAEDDPRPLPPPRPADLWAGPRLQRGSIEPALCALFG